MTIANEIKTNIVQSSWIRKMFNEGNKLKEKYGSNKIFDFSLGNPKIPPPNSFYTSIKTTLDSIGLDGHSYMSQTGYPETCQSIAHFVSEEQEVSVSKNEVIMTCGASGGLNIVLKSILNPYDEVITPKPCFVEYASYVNNHGGILKMVNTKYDFNLDLRSISDEINRSWIER